MEAVELTQSIVVDVGRLLVNCLHIQLTWFGINFTLDSQSLPIFASLFYSTFTLFLDVSFFKYNETKVPTKTRLCELFDC